MQDTTQEQEKNTTYTFEAIGTRWSIEVRQELSASDSVQLLKRIRACIEEYDRSYSRFRSDSTVHRMSQSPGIYALPPSAEELFSTYRVFYDATDGKVTPLIGDVLIAAGYDAGYSLAQNGELRTPPAWDSVFDYIDRKVTMKTPAMLDIGAGGKGHLVDLVGSVLEIEGVKSFVVDAGGDILVRDASPVRIGLEDPTDVSQVIGIATITSRSICGSAGNRRAWGDYHHVIDPHTLRSPRDILAVWAIADRAFHADMLTTALYFVSPETLKERLTFPFEFAVLYADGSLAHSKDFPGEFFTE